MRIRTLLIDGNYLLQRSFHGAKDTYTRSFGHCGGLYSFLTTTRKLIKEHKINKVIVVWDGENGGIYRRNIDHEYKANRKNKNKKIVLSSAQIKIEEEKRISILKQKVRIQAYSEELFLRQIEIEEIEADDLIASYCISHNNLEEIFIFTNDRDFLQLLDLNIQIIFSNIPQPINSTNFFFAFEYFYSNALIMKIICGDTSDNIKGIPGLAEGTLLKLFPEMKYKPLTVRDVCKLADDLNKERILLKKKPLKSLVELLSNIERLKINYKLVNLREPMLNDIAIEALQQLNMPLSPTNRGSKNLIKLMNEDEFLQIYGSTFVNYVEPFYTVIQFEKELYEKYKRSLRNK